MKSTLFASAVSGVLALTASAAIASSTSSVKKKVKEKIDPTTVGQCHGVNSCKGKGACGGTDKATGKEHACAGKNSCKGKGWLKVTKAECMAKKGKFKLMGHK